MLGWNILVVNLTSGGFRGYSCENLSVRHKIAPSHGVFSGLYYKYTQKLQLPNAINHHQ